jgi:hypothetical protein
LENEAMKTMTTMLAALGMIVALCSNAVAAPTEEVAFYYEKISVAAEAAPDALLDVADALHGLDGGAWRVFRVDDAGNGDAVLVDAEGCGDTGTFDSLFIPQGGATPLRGYVIADDMVLDAYSIEQALSLGAPDCPEPLKGVEPDEIDSKYDGGSDPLKGVEPDEIDSKYDGGSDPQEGVEPDEIDNNYDGGSDPLKGVEPDEIDSKFDGSSEPLESIDPDEIDSKFIDLSAHEKSSDAYFVKVDRDTTTQSATIGFAVLKLASK